MDLPLDFLNKKKKIMPESEYMDFLESYRMEKVQALR